MTRLLLPAVALLVALAPALPAPVVTAADERFTLGVLRRDGVVIPFAGFDDRRWVSAWPRDLRGLELPITLQDVPKKWWGGGETPSELMAWAEGTRLGSVRLEKPATIPIMCVPRVVMRSDYKSKEPVPAPRVQPYPKDALVVSDGREIAPLSLLPRTATEWSSMAVMMLDQFNQAEELAIRGFTAWRHPLPPQVRRRMPVTLETIYRAPMEEEGWSAYYVEAVRRYPPGPKDEDCGLVTFTSGWIRTGPSAKPLFDLRSRVTYCDRKGASYMLPLGLVTADGKPYWVYQMSGYDQEWLVVARPTRRDIQLHVEYQAGFCPS